MKSIYIPQKCPRYYQALLRSFRLLLLLALPICLNSCKTPKLKIDSVAYQSITTTCLEKQGVNAIPSDSQILLTFAIDQEGRIIVIVNNLTDKILTIDQERSFLVDTDGSSKTYYSNTIYASTETTYNFSSDSFNMNLGSLASAFGVGGRLGTLLGGMNVGTSTTTGTSQSRTTIMRDEKRINLGPHGSGVMSKNFPIKGIGRKALAENLSSTDYRFLSLNQNSSPLQFQIYISYSFDNGETFSRLDTKFYVDSMYSESVPDNHKTGIAMRKIMLAKHDLLSEPWYLISINNNLPDNFEKPWEGTIDRNDANIYDYIVNGLLFNYE